MRFIKLFLTVFFRLSRYFNYSILMAISSLRFKTSFQRKSLFLCCKLDLHFYTNQCWNISIYCLKITMQNTFFSVINMHSASPLQKSKQFTCSLVTVSLNARVWTFLTLNCERSLNSLWISEDMGVHQVGKK